MPVYLSGLGTVVPLNAVTVRSRVDGELLRVAFTEGQMANKGDLLAEIDPRPFQAQLAQAEGQLARDQALLENAKADLQRYRILLDQDSIASQQVTSQASLVRQYEAAIAIDRAQIGAIKLQLSYCRIVAPISGRVGLRQIDPGNVIRAGDQNGLVSIAQTQPIAAVFSLPEDKLPDIVAHLRGKRAISTEAYDRSGADVVARGKLLAIDNQIDSSTGTVKLKATFDNEDGKLFANQFVNVRLNLEPLRDAVVAPTAAIQRGAAGDFAYVVTEGGKVHLQPVRLGPRDGEKVAVLAGLAPNAEVVVEGMDRLKEGAAVQVVAGPSARKAQPESPRADAAKSPPEAAPPAGKPGRPGR